MLWAPTSSGNVPALCCGQQRVVEHARQVRHPRERRQLRPDPLQQLRDLGLVADVGREGVDPAPVALGDVGDRPLCVRIGRAPAGQHDVTGPELGQIGRRVQAECAEAAGDQIAPIAARL